MSVYLDSSALVKLVVEEPESEDLRTFVGDRVVVSSTVARTEVIRAVARTEPERVSAAEKVLAETSLIIIDGPLASAAAWVEPASIRSARCDPPRDGPAVGGRSGGFGDV